jgi:hypothetical protein
MYKFESVLPDDTCWGRLAQTTQTCSERRLEPKSQSIPSAQESHTSSWILVHGEVLTLVPPGRKVRVGSRLAPNVFNTLVVSPPRLRFLLLVFIAAANQYSNSLPVACFSRSPLYWQAG